MNMMLYRLPLPISDGMYVVGDAKLQQEILCDPLSSKLWEVYSSVNVIWGGVPSIITALGSPYWTLLQKTRNTRFANNQVQRMHEIARKHLEDWTQQSSNPGSNLADPGWTDLSRPMCSSWASWECSEIQIMFKI
jgi:hypothetical protein